jgi:hypothetical protein
MALIPSQQRQPCYQLIMIACFVAVTLLLVLEDALLVLAAVDMHRTCTQRIYV